MKNKYNRKQINETLLFIAMVLILLPIVGVSFFGIPGYVYTIEIGVAYLVQTCILIYTFNEGLWRVRENLLAKTVLAVFILSQIYICLLGLKNSVSPNVKEIINIFTLSINGYIIILANNYSLNETKLLSFMRNFVDIAIIACIYNIMLHFGDILSVLSGTNKEYLQIDSFFTNRNLFGAFLVFSIIALLIAKDIQQLNRDNWVLCLFVFNLLLTMSRSAIGTFIIVVTVKYIYEIVSKEYTIKETVTKCSIELKYMIGGIASVFFKRIFAGILILILLVASISSERIVSDKSDKSLGENLIRAEDIGSVAGRTVIWKEGLKIWNTHRILGVGRFGAIERLHNSREDCKKFTQFHNAYIEVLASHGILGLMIYLFLFLWILRKIYRSRMPIKQKGIFYAMYISMGIQSLFETRIRFSMGFVDTFSMFFLVVIPILYINNYSEKVEIQAKDRLSKDSERNEPTYS
ncbi:O-antigen ligase family protein [Anaerovorax odorimutans]|uniref:O-antigen ligase family protein n=1 Tax=Anaerovorax odorimutans TaxID=109327 RepID=A0ABT1RJD2_9FIRM|nr:O-antigen ligase family protein [Anaerovorax odorimutans]MCQ4635290.1 O-antigen ligase family protein [Anaerovorax odorimutans]